MSGYDHGDDVRRIPTHWLLRELERRNVPPVDAQAVEGCPGLRIDRGNRTATRGETTVALRSREVEVLRVLAARHPDAVPTETIAAVVWPEAVWDVECVRYYVSGLRKKLPGLIGSRRGVGYWLDLPAAS